MKSGVAHICQITTSHDVFDRRVFRRTALSLARAGLRVTLIAQHHKDQVVDGIQILALPKKRGLLSRILLTRQALKLAMRAKADLYHFHDDELLPAMVCLAWRTKSPVVYDVHELHSEAIRAYAKHCLIRTFIPPLFRIFERFAVKRFAGIIIVSEELQQRYDGICRRSAIVRNVVDLKELGNIQPGKRNMGKPCLFTAGTVSRDRCGEEMIEGFLLARKHVPELTIRILGTYTPPAFGAHLMSIAEKSGAGDDVFVQPPRPWREMMAIAGDASMGMVLYRPYGNNLVGLPNRLFEYMAAGIPIIASDLPALRKIVGKYQCGILVDALSPEDICRGVVELLTDSDKANEMGRRGRKAIQEELNWQKETQKLFDLYARVGVRCTEGIL